MSKILKKEEINKKLNEHKTYTVPYDVRFYLQLKNEFWEENIVTYYAESLGEDNAVKKRWRSDYSKQKVRYISMRNF